jgi:hypothetical protein
MACFAMTRPRAGTVAELPQTLPTARVLRYEPLAAPGSQLTDPTNLVSAIASLIIVGETRSVADARLANRSALVSESTSDTALNQCPSLRRGSLTAMLPAAEVGSSRLSGKR